MLSEIQELQAEVGRLRLIVRLLADRNRELEQLLADALSDRQKQPLQSSMQMADGALKDIPSPDPVLHGGTDRVHNSMLVLDGAKKVVQQSMQTEHGGLHDVQTLDPKPDVAFVPVTKAFAETDGQKMPLPELPVLMARLKKNGMAGVKDSGVERAARLLLWVARESGPISYAEMQQNFGMTGGGVAKMVASLLRRGWLRRSTRYCFALTESGSQLLNPPPGAAHACFALPGCTEGKGDRPHP